MYKTHYRLPGGAYACGIGQRWMSQQISSVTSIDRITCLACRRVLSCQAGAKEGSAVGDGGQNG